MQQKEGNNPKCLFSNLLFARTFTPKCRVQSSADDQKRAQPLAPKPTAHKNCVQQTPFAVPRTDYVKRKVTHNRAFAIPYATRPLATIADLDAPQLEVCVSRLKTRPLGQICVVEEDALQASARIWRVRAAAYMRTFRYQCVFGGGRPIASHLSFVVSPRYE